MKRTILNDEPIITVGDLRKIIEPLTDNCKIELGDFRWIVYIVGKDENFITLGKKYGKE
jgi:hypothetical protein